MPPRMTSAAADNLTLPPLLIMRLVSDWMMKPSVASRSIEPPVVLTSIPAPTRTVCAASRLRLPFVVETFAFTEMLLLSPWALISKLSRPFTLIANPSASPSFSVISPFNVVSTIPPLTEATTSLWANIVTALVIAAAETLLMVVETESMMRLVASRIFTPPVIVTALKVSTEVSSALAPPPSSPIPVTAVICNPCALISRWVSPASNMAPAAIKLTSPVPALMPARWMSAPETSATSLLAV